jgi:hypothetical protein
MDEKDYSRMLEKGNLIDFLSDLENYGYSIVQVVPQWMMQKRSILSRLKNTDCVVSAKELDVIIEKECVYPSRLVLLVNRWRPKEPWGYIMIHDPQLNHDGPYKVHLFKEDYHEGFKKVPFSWELIDAVLPEKARDYLKE